jgi:poly(3-hydroxybutyrate) depolymerase
MRRFLAVLAALPLGFFWIPGAAAFAEEFPRGKIIDAVPCAADATQSYALYLPSNYSPDRRWKVILGFDAGGRGRNPVERFQAAAEKYGYIVAGSLNSRNGPLGVSVEAANAMWKDVAARFSVDKTHLYTTGQSGGARVAMYLAMHREVFADAPAGVIASSASYPGTDAPESLPFPVFGTAGTEDFNHLEMRQFDQRLQSRHRVAIFEGGHQWLPVPLAMTAVEWMEIDAMKTGLNAKNQAVIDDIFARRLDQEKNEKDVVARHRELAELATDFTGLKDVNALMNEAGRLGKDPAVNAAFDKAAAEDEREDQLTGTLLELAARLRYPSRRNDSLREIKKQVSSLAEAAAAPRDSSERQMSRRVLRSLMASTRDVRDEDFQVEMKAVQDRLGRF